MTRRQLFWGAAIAVKLWAGLALAFAYEARRAYSRNGARP